jgi:hypothetical protein
VRIWVVGPVSVEESTKSRSDSRLHRRLTERRRFGEHFRLNP